MVFSCFLGARGQALTCRLLLQLGVSHFKSSPETEITLSVLTQWSQSVLSSQFSVLGSRFSLLCLNGLRIYLCGLPAQHLTNLCGSFKCHLWSRPHSLPSSTLFPLYYCKGFVAFCLGISTKYSPFRSVMACYAFCLTYLWHVYSQFRTSRIYVFISPIFTDIAVGLMHN